MEDIAKSMKISNSDSGFMKSYMQAYNLAQQYINESGEFDWEGYQEATKTKVDDITLLLQKDTELTKMVQRLSAKDNVYTYQQLLDYYESKITSTDTIADYVANVNAGLQKFANQQKILDDYNVDTKLSNESLASLADIFGTTSETVSKYLDMYMSLLGQSVETGMQTILSSYLSSLLDLIIEYAKQNNIADLSTITKDSINNPAIKSMLDFLDANNISIKLSGKYNNESQTFEGVNIEHEGNFKPTEINSFNTGKNYYDGFTTAQLIDNMLNAADAKIYIDSLSKEQKDRL